MKFLLMEMLRGYFSSRVPKMLESLAEGAGADEQRRLANEVWNHMGTQYVSDVINLLASGMITDPQAGETLALAVRAYGAPEHIGKVIDLLLSGAIREERAMWHLVEMIWEQAKDEHASGIIKLLLSGKVVRGEAQQRLAWAFEKLAKPEHIPLTLEALKSGKITDGTAQFTLVWVLRENARPNHALLLQECLSQIRGKLTAEAFKLFMETTKELLSVISPRNRIYNRRAIGRGNKRKPMKH
ncbi:MAG: hypothetical protein QXP42_01785 [Candidatus Micrarchaeia archaeon]